MRRYRVIDKKTKEDITNKYNWVITPNGKLFYLVDEGLISHPHAMDLPEKCMGAFLHTVQTLKNLNYYNNNDNIKV